MNDLSCMFPSPDKLGNNFVGDICLHTLHTNALSFSHESESIACTRKLPCWKHVVKLGNIQRLSLCYQFTKMYLSLLGNIFASWKANFVFATMTISPEVDKQGNSDSKQCFLICFSLSQTQHTLLRCEQGVGVGMEAQHALN